jgi:hypothetical protein
MVFAYYLIYKRKKYKVIYKSISYRNNRSRGYRNS